MSTGNWTLTDINRIKAKMTGEPIAIPVSDKPTKYETKLERDFQTMCENWLIQRGYLRSTKENAGKFCSGWIVHLYNTKKNPLLPDLLVLSFGWEYSLPLELKVREVFQPGQKEFIDAGIWKLCRLFDDVRHKVVTWEEMHK